jgi:hypothetical protein
MRDREIVINRVTLRDETDLGFKIEFEDGRVWWYPKSKARYDPVAGTLTVPEWLQKTKEEEAEAQRVTIKAYVFRESPKALEIGKTNPCHSDYRIWIPKSRIIYDDDAMIGDLVEIQVEKWLTESEEWDKYNQILARHHTAHRPEPRPAPPPIDPDDEAPPF